MDNLKKKLKVKFDRQPLPYFLKGKDSRGNSDANNLNSLESVASNKENTIQNPFFNKESKAHSNLKNKKEQSGKFGSEKTSSDQIFNHSKQLVPDKSPSNPYVKETKQSVPAKSPFNSNTKEKKEAKGKNIDSNPKKLIGNISNHLKSSNLRIENKKPLNQDNKPKLFGEEDNFELENSTDNHNDFSEDKNNFGDFKSENKSWFRDTSKELDQNLVVRNMAKKKTKKFVRKIFRNNDYMNIYYNREGVQKDLTSKPLNEIIRDAGILLDF